MILSVNTEYLKLGLICFAELLFPYPGPVAEDPIC